MKDNKTLAIIVPCYNEEEILKDTNSKLIKKVNELKEKKLIKKIVIFYILMMGAKIIHGQL